MSAAKAPCPCGCGDDVPRRAGNVWRSTEPYWAWICINPECAWRDQEYRNQSGDRECSMCRRARVFVGHYQQGGEIASKTGRTTVLGKFERRRHAATFYFNGRGLLENEAGPGFSHALYEEPVGDDPNAPWVS